MTSDLKTLETSCSLLYDKRNILIDKEQAPFKAAVLSGVAATTSLIFLAFVTNPLTLLILSILAGAFISITIATSLYIKHNSKLQAQLSDQVNEISSKIVTLELQQKLEEKITGANNKQKQVETVIELTEGLSSELELLMTKNLKDDDHMKERINTLKQRFDKDKIEYQEYKANFEEFKEQAEEAFKGINDSTTPNSDNEILRKIRGFLEKIEKNTTDIDSCLIDIKLKKSHMESLIGCFKDFVEDKNTFVLENSTIRDSLQALNSTITSLKETDLDDYKTLLERDPAVKALIEAIIEDKSVENIVSSVIEKCPEQRSSRGKVRFLSLHLHPDKTTTLSVNVQAFAEELLKAWNEVVSMQTV